MERDKTFDVMKGIGIILVVMGHSDFPRWFETIIYSFHMPMFYIISGYFYHPKKTKDVFRRDCKKLLIPYFLVCFVFCMYALFDVLRGQPEKAVFWTVAPLLSIPSPADLFHFPSMWPIWFLLSLFWCRIIFNVIYNYFSNLWIITPFIVMMAVLGHCISHVIPSFWALTTAFVAIVFYYIGWLVRVLSERALPDSNVRKMFVLILSIFWLFSNIYGGVDVSRVYYKNGIVDIIGAVGGTYWIYFLSQKLSLLQYSNKLADIGKITIVILFFHAIIIRVIPFPNCVQFDPIVRFLVYFLTAWLCARLSLKTYLGQKVFGYII